MNPLSMLGDVKSDVLFFFAYTEANCLFDHQCEYEGYDECVSDCSECSDTLGDELLCISCEKPVLASYYRNCEDTSCESTPQATHSMNSPCIKAFIKTFSDPEEHHTVAEHTSDCPNDARA